jgi:predicted Zn-dependent protease with MMP-like domain
MFRWVRLTLCFISIEAVCSNETEVRHQIRQTLMHGLGHYFGMTEEQLKDV